MGATAGYPLVLFLWLFHSVTPQDSSDRKENMAHLSQYQESDFYRKLSGTSQLKLYAAIFFVFAPLALIVATGPARGWPWWVLVAWVAGSGLIAVGWAAAFMRNLKLLVLVIPGQIMIGLGSSWLMKIAGLGTPVITLAGALSTVLIVLGYVFFIMFINKEGKRSLRLQTEIGLAEQIHSHLVPTVSLRTPQLEIYGQSISSSEVGGDLVDVVQDHGHLGLYVADVSGHGVKAGVLMSMVKSAIRMKLLHSGNLEHLCSDLNNVVFQVKEPETFVTFAAMRFGTDGQAHYVLAGHPSILRFSKNTHQIEELPNDAPPLGVVDGSPFVQTSIDVESGDLFVLLTDGLIEIVDEWDPDLGMKRIKELILSCAHEPVDIAHAYIMREIRGRAEVDDDQTLLLARAI